MRCRGMPLLAMSALPAALAQTVAIDPATTYQVIRGFGGHNGAGWIADLTPAQVDTAFGTGPGQIGLTVMRMRIDLSSTAWATQVRLLTPQLLERLAREVGEGVVETVTVLGPAGPSFRRGKKSVRGPGPRDTWG